MMTERKLDQLDPDRLTEQLADLAVDDLIDLAADALLRLPVHDIPDVIRGYMRMDWITRRDVDPERLVKQAKAFSTSTWMGEYDPYFAGGVFNDRRDLAHDTRLWVRRHNRMILECAEAAEGAPSEDVEYALSKLLYLLLFIYDGKPLIVLEPDEPPRYQIATRWDAFFPAWATCLAISQSPESYAELVGLTLALTRLWDDPDIRDHLSSIGSPAHQDALASYQLPELVWPYPVLVAVGRLLGEVDDT